MGTEYMLFNHANCTSYDLGKGNWFDLKYREWVLTDEEVLLDDLQEMWPSDAWPGPGHDEYLKLLAKDLRRFVGDTPGEQLEVISDGGDEHWMARSLGYVCTGSRYELNNPARNAGHVRQENEFPAERLGRSDLEYLRQGKWNFSKYMCLAGATGSAADS